MAKRQSNGEYYWPQMLQYENDIVRLNAEVEKTNEGCSVILSLFGKGDLAKARKDLATKDEQIDLLGAAFMLATAGPAQIRVGTGSGGSHSDLPWDGKKNTGRRR